MPLNNQEKLSSLKGGVPEGGGGLLEHFKELTVHPKNAQELKGLILQLAIQGKLTKAWREQNPDVEPASVLLEKIQEEKTKLVKEKKIKKEKPFAEISTKEITYKLPEGWSWCRLGEVGFTQTGSTPPKNDISNYGDYIPFIGPADISNSWMKYPEEGLSEKGISVGRLIPKNSLMMVCIGGSIGKCNINKIDVSCNQQINTITPILSQVGYIKTVCQSPFFQKEVINKASGSATPIINKGKWDNITFPTPPLEEQKAIVATVNQLFTEVEALEEQTKARVQLKEDFVTSALQQLATGDTIKEWSFLQEHFKTFFTEKSAVKKLRESILQLAVQGKMTANWRKEHPVKTTGCSPVLGELSEGLRGKDIQPPRPADTPPSKGGELIEHASILLEKIKAEKEQLIKDKKIKKEKPLPEITEEEIPYALPEGWAWCRWVDLLGMVDHPMKRGPFGSSLRKDDFVEKGIRVFEQYNPINNDPNWMRYFITNEKYESMKGFTAKAGDFLVSCSGATLGRIVYLPKGTIAGIINQALLKLTLSQDIILSEYFLKLFRSYYIQELIWQKAQGMAQPNMVGVKELKNILIPLPPLEEQKAIVEKVNALMGLCDSLEQEIEQSTTQVEQLMQSCLKEVFE
ncbi:restriction endonuclease subunit S [Fulvivirga sp.]|uniref:restriction endonuclease subunit S n=1 Tax=Fulvivirga sp. TaxID=1931237 RepID=UPI0032F002B9